MTISTDRTLTAGQLMAAPGQLLTTDLIGFTGSKGRQPDMSRGQSESPKRVDIGHSLGTTSKSFNLPIFNVRLKGSAELLPLVTARPD